MVLLYLFESHGFRRSLDFAITTPIKVNVEEASDVN